MTPSRKPRGIPTGGQFAPVNRPEATGLHLVDDEISPLPDGFEDLVVAGGPLRGDGRIMGVVEDPGGDGRDRWSVCFENGEQDTGFADEFELVVDESGGPVSRRRSEDAASYQADKEQR